MAKLYLIEFIGHYPIGAYAVVSADDKTQARCRFFAHLMEEDISLYDKNVSKDIDISEVKSPLGYSCQIISTGDY